MRKGEIEEERERASDEGGRNGGSERVGEGRKGAT